MAVHQPVLLALSCMGVCCALSDKREQKQRRKKKEKKKRKKKDIKKYAGIPVVAQWLMNPTGNHEVSGSIPGLAQWGSN